MRLRGRLAAGVRAMTDGWARDLCLLYGIEPGEELHVSVYRPDSAPGVVEVRVQRPESHAGPVPPERAPTAP